MKTAYRKWISERLKYFRDLHKMSVQEVASKIEANPKTYSAYEQERTEPSLSTVEKLCQLYKITVDEFLKGSPTQSA